MSGNGIQSTPVMTVDSMINWLEVLSRGYAKPDLSDSPNGTGTVNETKHYMPFIMKINKRLCKMSGLECPDIPESLSSFSVHGYNKNR